MLARAPFTSHDAYMSGHEMIQIPGAAVAYLNVGNEILGHLIADDKLPPDFQFRLQGIAQEDRSRIATADILHALGYGSGSGETYLTGPLPPCVFVPGFHDTYPLSPLLERLDEDYHTLGVFSKVARNMGEEPYVARQSWALYFKHLDPAQYESLLTKESDGRRDGYWVSRKSRQFARVLGRTIIKDEALLQIYKGEIPVPGHAQARQRLLHYLLLDNHPELGPDPQ